MNLSNQNVNKSSNSQIKQFLKQKFSKRLKNFANQIHMVKDNNNQDANSLGRILVISLVRIIPSSVKILN